MHDIGLKKIFMNIIDTAGQTYGKQALTVLHAAYRTCQALSEYAHGRELPDIATETTA